MSGFNNTTDFKLVFIGMKGLVKSFLHNDLEFY